MTIREQVTTAALLGNSIQFTGSGQPLDGLLSRLNEREPSLLDALALVTAYEAAGTVPRTAPAALEPAPIDQRDAFGEVVAGHLAAILSDRQELLGEWLTALSDSGLRPPAEWIPKLLNAGGGEYRLRPLVIEAVGPTGQWLTQFQPNWSWVGEPDFNEALWEEGTVAERMSTFREIRRLDPKRAREMAVPTWPAEAADTKRQIVETLGIGRSLDDEAFLEAALDDRSVVVRRAAAEQLAGIPGSQLSERMRQRLTGRLQLTPDGVLIRKSVLLVDPFAELTPPMLRDGIEKKPSGTQLGERAWWTAQALAAVDPEVWLSEFAQSPQHLVEAARNGEWSGLLIEGWRTAAIRYRHPAWLDALADDTDVILEAGPLMDAMAPPAREAAVRRKWGHDAKAWLPPVPATCSHQWSLEFTEAFVALVALFCSPEPGDPFRQHVKSLLRHSAYRASPWLASVPTHEAFDEFSDILSFRRAMRQAFLEPPNHAR